MIKNYYQILGLNFDSTKEEVKKAYRIYATKFHPDKQNNDKFFEERFKEIKEAYDILIDENKRSIYDSKLKNESKSSSYSNYSDSSNKYRNSVYEEELKEKERIRKEKEIMELERLRKENIERERLRKEKENIEKERLRIEELKKKKIYYTSQNLIVNGIYINCNGITYKLTDYDSSTIRKNDNSSFVLIGIIMIVICVFTFAFFIGILIFFFGIYALFYKEYFIVLIGRNGDIPLIKGLKYKMKKISRLINIAIKDNNI